MALSGEFAVEEAVGGPVGRQTAKWMNGCQIPRYTLGRRLGWLWALSERSDKKRNPIPWEESNPDRPDCIYKNEKRAQNICWETK